MARKRPYSTDFPPKNPRIYHRYLLDRIPIGLWIRVQAKAKREHKSLRNVILAFLTTWVEN